MVQTPEVVKPDLPHPVVPVVAVHEEDRPVYHVGLERRIPGVWPGQTPGA